jgi:hypothetical protein
MKKLTYEEAKQKFIDQGRNDIVLLESGYVRWKANAVFFDNIVNEEFIAIPHNVYVQRSCHPKRSIEKRKNTCLRLYGATSSLHGTTAAGLAVQEKVRATCKSRFGTENPFANAEIQKRSKSTMIQKYGVENISQLRKKLVADKNITVEQWFNMQSEPKPASYQSFGAMFLYGTGSNTFTTEQLEHFLNEFRSAKTKLERLGEQLFEQTHYNKKPSPTIPYRPDFKLNERVFVNVDGLYWHSENEKAKNYHVEVRKAFELESYRIFQFYEDEIRNKSSIVSSIVKHAIGKTERKIHARKTEIKNVSQQEATKFLEDNHLMGSIKGNHIGLYDCVNNCLVSLLTYKVFRKKKCLVVERFCSKNNCLVNGGFSKLLKRLLSIAFSKDVNEIHYWTDLRYATGAHLISHGFKIHKETLGWKWSDGINTYNRLRCRANMDDRKLTEKEYAHEKGWYRIYDAGQRLYVKFL